MGADKLVIGVDIDGVLADFNTAYINLCVELSGRDLFPPRPFDIPCWSYPEHYGYSKDEVSAVWSYIKQHSTFWSDLNAYPAAEEALGLLSLCEMADDDVYFITSRPGITAKLQTEVWLRRLRWDRATVLISAAKGQCAAALGIGAYVDDRWENCVDVATTTKARVYMVDQPWNRGNSPDVYGIHVITSAVEFARELAERRFVLV